jgi:hypothetical protein
MRHTCTLRALFLLLVATTFWSSAVAAQSSGDSAVADAARQARAKKKAAGKPAAVITNDTLPSAPSGSAPSSPPGAPSSSAAPALNPPAPPETPPVDEGEKKTAIAALRQEIADKQEALDVEQGGLALDSDTYYSKPDFDRDKDGKARLDAMQVDLQQKQNEITRLKTKLASLGALPADAKP